MSWRRVQIRKGIRQKIQKSISKVGDYYLELKSRDVHLPKLAQLVPLPFSWGYRKFHIISRKNPNLHHLPQNFFSFRLWLNTLKLEKNPKFQVLGSSGIQLFGFRIGPSDLKITAEMKKWGLPYVTRYQFLTEFCNQ